ncbi:MAG TPA: glycosyltransferase family 39 protein [Patescibacteria group bacterium]
MKKFFTPFNLILLVGSLIYLATHLPSLTLLPVFADEAIYLRWAQLILDDWRQYLFFPLNDGKTPLFVWLAVLSLKIFADPLLAGRMVSLAVGLLQVAVIAFTIKKLRGGRLAICFGQLAIIGLPFWYFHHRMALMDGLLVLMLSLALYHLIVAGASKIQRWQSALKAGVFFGLALLTKLPALLFMPALVLAPWLVKPKKSAPFHFLSLASATLLIGLGIFLTLKIHPVFGQLFNRGNDFLYSISEVLAAGVWPIVVSNSTQVWQVLNAYLSWPLLLLPLMGLWHTKWRRKHLILILSSLGFLIPVILLSRIIFPRYLLPAALPLTISASLAFEQFFLITQRLIKKPVIFLIRTSALIFGLTFMTSISLQFLLISWQDPNHLPFTEVDREQYLRSWAAGNGIKETTNNLLQAALTSTIAVATEGYFGTLPDGILMYLHNQDVTNILVEGIGQPVHRLPDDFIAKAQYYEQVWLVVNSHRQLMNLATNPQAKLEQGYCRIAQGPCLQVWNITALVHTQP